jgi:hypothetical protein
MIRCHSVNSDTYHVDQFMVAVTGQFVAALIGARKEEHVNKLLKLIERKFA